MSLPIAFPPLTPGSTFDLPAGRFNYGLVKTVFPSGTPEQAVTIRGKGIGKTVLLCSAYGVSDGLQFALGNTIIRNMTLSFWNAAMDMPWKPLDDSGLTGFNAQPAGVRPYSAEIHHCELISPGWAVYYWGDDPNNGPPSLLIADSIIRFARIGVAAGNSGNGQNFTIERTVFLGDASLAHYGGEVPEQGGLLAILARGGRMQIKDCTTFLLGAPDDPANGSYTPRCMSLSDNLGVRYPPAGGSTVEIENLRSYLSPNGAKDYRDLDLNWTDNVVIDGLRIRGGS